MSDKPVCPHCGSENLGMGEACVDRDAEHRPIGDERDVVLRPAAYCKSCKASGPWRETKEWAYNAFTFAGTTTEDDQFSPLDEVAVRVLVGLHSVPAFDLTHLDAAVSVIAFDAAEAFMAERERRRKMGKHEP